MSRTAALPAIEKCARRAAEIHAAWTADPEMPVVAGTVADAVRVMAVRAAVYEDTGDAASASLPAPVAVELSGLLLAVQFSELGGVEQRTGHPFLPGGRAPWVPGDYTHRVCREAFGPGDARHWPEG